MIKIAMNIRLPLAALLFSHSAAGLHAQIAAELRGHVVDSSGAAVTNAEVDLVSMGRNNTPRCPRHQLG